MVVLKIGPFLTFLNLIMMGRALCAHYRSIDKFVKNGPIFKTTTLKKFNTVHNLISFSMVFTNKNREGGHFEPPPPIITKVVKTREKKIMPSFAFIILISLEK